MSMISAQIDELRKLACDINEEEIRSHSVIRLNQGRYNRQFRLDMNHDWLNAWHAELERILQGIEATLWRGECRIEHSGISWSCSACKEEVGSDDPTSERFIDGNAIELWEFCPQCGAKVVDE